tara:strand:+ start:448 stop:582 length:135 start_codon:yes stop_codon:yes gene_type:complete
VVFYWELIQCKDKKKKNLSQKIKTKQKKTPQKGRFKMQINEFRI